MVLPPIAGLSYTGWFPNHVTNGVDYSWVVGLVVSGLVYLILSRSLDLAAEQAAIEASERELQAIDVTRRQRPPRARPPAAPEASAAAEPARPARRHQRTGSDMTEPFRGSSPATPSARWTPPWCRGTPGRRPSPGCRASTR